MGPPPPARSSALNMHSNNGEHPMLKTKWAKSHKGNLSQQKMRHQVKTMKSISWSFPLNILAKNLGRSFTTEMSCQSHTRAAQL